MTPRAIAWPRSWRSIGSASISAPLLLQGGDAADRGGEMCACFGVSCNAVETAIARGATSLDAVGAATRAGTNCGSCRPEIRLLLRTARPKKAA